MELVLQAVQDFFSVSSIVVSYPAVESTCCRVSPSRR